MSGCSIKRLITLTVPIHYQRVTLFDNDNLDVTSSALFSWSMDGACWTNWVNFGQYNNLASHIEGDFYLRILIVTGFSKIALGGKVSNCYTICLYNENPYLADLCTNQTIDFYAGLDCALQMYIQMSDLICCMVGIPIYYFRVLPDKDTKDLTFKEYVLHNVVDMKNLKMVLQDGTMPSSKPQMTEFDFDWETDWEVEISKTAFAKAFGDTAFPKQRDMVYVPLMKRMWEVNSAYDEKAEAFMWQPTTWKLGLVKWNEKTNVDQGDFEQLIDSLTKNRMEDILVQEKEEQRRETATEQTQSPTFRPENLYSVEITDAVRKAVSQEELNSISKLQLNHRAAVVTRNFYNFKKADSSILYSKKWCSDCGTLLFCIDTREGYITEPKTIFAAGNLTVDIDGNVLKFNNLEWEIERDGVYMVKLVWDRLTFTTSLVTYPYICMAPPNTPPYKIKPEMYIFDFNNPVCSLTGPYNNDFIQDKVDVYLSPAPLQMTNIRLYDCMLSEEDAAKECIKYTTKNEHCVINDVARPFTDEYGFNVR